MIVLLTNYVAHMYVFMSSWVMIVMIVVLVGVRWATFWVQRVSRSFHFEAQHDATSA